MKKLIIKIVIKSCLLGLLYGVSGALLDKYKIIEHHAAWSLYGFSFAVISFIIIGIIDRKRKKDEIQ